MSKGCETNASLRFFFLTKVIQNFTWDSNKIEILLILFYVLSVKRKSSLSVGKQ